jgi:hypothetical protein
MGQATSVGVWIAALSLVGLLIRQIIPWKKLTSDAEAKLRDDLIRRVGNLERSLERERNRHDAERRLLHHQLNNVTACFDSLLLLIETSPEKAKEVAAKIKAMRSAQLIAEAEEKAIIMAAALMPEEGQEDEGSGDGE